MVYVPEKTFNIDRFLKEVKEVYDSLGRCVVAISEGVHNEEGEYFLQTYADQTGSELAGKKDSHGNIQLSGSGALGDTLTNLVSEYIDGARVRADTFGYLQRSFIADISKVDAEEAERVGKYAVVASKELDSGSVAIDLGQNSARPTVCLESSKTHKRYALRVSRSCKVLCHK